jgi:hypothetical protein
MFEFFNVAPITLPNADFNNDGTVDAADYAVWRKNTGTNVTPGTLGDADYSGHVDDADYQIWRAQFGTSPGAAGARGNAAENGTENGSAPPNDASAAVIQFDVELVSSRRPRRVATAEHLRLSADVVDRSSNNLLLSSLINRLAQYAVTTSTGGVDRALDPAAALRIDSLDIALDLFAPFWFPG